MLVRLMYMTRRSDVRLVAAGRPGRYGDGRRAVGVAPRSRRAASPGRSAAPVVAGPGRVVGAGSCPAAGAVAASDRHPGHAVVLAPPPGQPALDLEGCQRVIRVNLSPSRGGRGPRISPTLTRTGP